VSTVQEIESAIQRLPRRDVRQLFDWIEDYLEDELEFTDEFKASIERGERQLAEGKGRVRKPSPAK
jgi:cell division septum initiation protein DivIVA